MLIFLYGPDTYRSHKKLNEIIESYKKIHKNGLSLVYLNGQDLEFKNLEDELKTTSIFKEKKLLVIKNAFSDKKFKEELLRLAEKFSRSADLILFYEENEVDKRNSFFKFLEKKSKIQEFQFLTGGKLENWLAKYISDYKANIEAAALKKLILFVGNDLWQMENEVIKLANYAKDRKIKEEDVDLLVRPKIENDIFETISSLAERKKDKALFLLHQHLEKGDSPLYLLSMINFQFRNLLEIKDLVQKKVPYSGILKQSSLHPFVIRKTYWQAQKFGFTELKKIYHKIFQIDLAIKTGKIEPETALDLLIANL